MSVPDPPFVVWRRAATIAAVAFFAASAVHVWVLRGFANSGDEFAYVWQATAFASGQMTAVTPQPAESFRQNHLGDINGRRFSKYPPGWPLLLAGGVFAGVAGFVNPLLGALALAGIYVLGCNWVGARPALLGVVAIGLSPFFLLNAASFHSHPSCLFALTCLALCLHRAGRGRELWPCVLAGASFGLAVLVRPYTALLIGVPLCLGLGLPLLRSQQHWRWRVVGGFVLGGVPSALFLLAVNDATTGSPWMLAWTYYDKAEVVGFGTLGHSVQSGLLTAVRLVAEGLVYTGGIAGVSLLSARGPAFQRRGLLWILLLAPVAGHVFWWSHGGNRYGPRFYFEAVLPLALLVGVGLHRLMARSPRVLVAATVLLTTASGSILGYRAFAQVDARRDVYRVAQAASLQNAVILLTTASADMVRTDLNRNPPNFDDAPILYGLSRPGADDEVVRAFPDRTVYYYRWEPEGGVLWRSQMAPGAR